MSKTLLFIPDISGFTDFVKAVEVAHSKHITKEILELLIQEIGQELKLAEIEGDALFYYQDADKINSTQLLNLIEQLFNAFHSYLNLYRFQRVCNCGACTYAGELNLKFVVLEGEADMIEVNGQSKPFGPDVILAHRLLKNKVDSKEYLLFEDHYYKSHKKTIDLKYLSSQSFEDLIDGSIVKYTAALLERPALTVEDHQQYPQVKGLPWVSTNQIIKAKADEVYQTIVNFEKREQWNYGVDKVIYKDTLNQIDSEHVCVIDGNKINFKTVFKNIDSEVLIYAEEATNVPFLTCMYNILKVESVGDDSKVIASAHLKPINLLGKLMIPLIKHQIKSGMSKSLIELSKLF